MIKLKRTFSVHYHLLPHNFLACKSKTKPFYLGRKVCNSIPVAWSSEAEGKDKRSPVAEGSAGFPELRGEWIWGTGRDQDDLVRCQGADITGSYISH